MNENMPLMFFMKRPFDLIVSGLLLVLLFWVIFFSWLIASVDTRANGFFLQKRVGKDGRLFNIIKIRTMNTSLLQDSTVTVLGDHRVTRSGRIFRRLKIDELPQLWNVFWGDMSFVGPRPDVPGYADTLPSKLRDEILSVRPGITGPATLAYRNEEELLSQHEDPQRYNDDVIYPDKVKINLKYIRNWKFRSDLLYLWQTIVS